MTMKPPAVMPAYSHRTYIRKELRFGTWWFVTCDECDFAILRERWDAALALANYHTRSSAQKKKKKSTRKVPQP